MLEPPRPAWPRLLVLLVLAVVGWRVLGRPLGAVQHPRTVWLVAAGDTIRQPLCLVGGRVMVAPEDGHLCALDAADGSLVWETRLHTPATAGPAAVAGRVIVGTREGRLLALAAHDGQVLWRVQLGDAAVGQTLAWGDRLVALTEAGALWVLDPADGGALWRRTASPGPTGVTAIDGHRLALTWPDGRVELVGREGATRWSTAATRVAARFPLAALGRLYVVGDDGLVRGLDLADGSVRQEARLGAGVAVPFAATAELLYLATDDGRVVTLGPEGSRWAAHLPAPAEGRPGIAGNLLLVPCQDRHIHALDPTSGRGVWSLAMRGDVTAELVTTPAGTFLATWDGEVGRLSVP